MQCTVQCSVVLQEITLSSGECFHYKCFQCTLCGADVSKQKYGVERGHLLCGPCLRTAARSACHKCILNIEMEGENTGEIILFYTVL